MRIGAALFVIAVGAILDFAVTKQFSAINLNTVGLILMIVGIVGLVLEVIWMSTRRRTDVVQRPNGVTYVTPHEPIDRPY